MLGCDVIPANPGETIPAPIDAPGIDNANTIRRIAANRQAMPTESRPGHSVKARAAGEWGQIKEYLVNINTNNCATVRAVGPKVIHLAAEDCVELSSGTVKQVCATVDELAPFLEAIMSARQSAAKKSLLDGGTD